MMRSVMPNTPANWSVLRDRGVIVTLSSPQRKGQHRRRKEHQQTSAGGYGAGGKSCIEEASGQIRGDRKRKAAQAQARGKDPPTEAVLGVELQQSRRENPYRRSSPIRHQPASPPPPHSL